MKISLKEKDQGLLTECKKILKENPNLKKRRLHLINDLEKRLFYLKVWAITESQPLHILENHGKRCFKGVGCYHLDHICSIHEGFKNKIPPEVIGNIKNLRFIPAKQNMNKGYKVTKSRLQETIRKGKIFRKKNNI
jgi:hypothetical protein